MMYNRCDEEVDITFKIKLKFGNILSLFIVYLQNKNFETGKLIDLNNNKIYLLKRVETSTKFNEIISLIPPPTLAIAQNKIFQIDNLLPESIEYEIIVNHFKSHFDMAFVNKKY